MMNFRSTFADWILAVVLVCSLLKPSSGQEDQVIGVDICYCAPNTYQFTLDFSLFCPPVNITLGDAIKATTCSVSPFGDPSVTDLVPVAVQSIDVLELDQNLQVISQEQIEGNFGDGDTFEYTSVAANPGDIVDAADLPRAIQLNINGVNELEQAILNVYLITFTNNCSSYPVLSEGQSAGWTVFVSLVIPMIARPGSLKLLVVSNTCHPFSSFSSILCDPVGFGATKSRVLPCCPH